MINEEDLENILSQVLEDIKAKGNKIVLSQISKETGVTRAVLRRWQANGYHIIPYKKRGRTIGASKLASFAPVIDDFLKKGVTNVEVIIESLKTKNYSGGKTIIYDYIRAHQNLIPAPRRIVVAPQENRGRRYYTGPGDCFQMDWGFINVEDEQGNKWQSACFAMVCHHCGFQYIEFFSNAKQENLFIGMIHAFMVMGIPKRVLTDNMKSVVNKRDSIGTPIYNLAYDEFQKTIGFKTDLCKVAHPFTKGKVERLVQYVKQNFIIGKKFYNVTDLNRQAFEWSMKNNTTEKRISDFIAIDEHMNREFFNSLPDKKTLLAYLAPIRSISFDGFVNYEGRRYGVPYSYVKKTARVMRKNESLYILDDETGNILTRHVVDWSKHEKICKNQWNEQPEEYPTSTVTATLEMLHPKIVDRFARFSIHKGEKNNEH